MSLNNTPSSPLAASSASAVLPAEPRHPVQQACSRLFDLYKGGNSCEVLQVFDEIQALELEAFPEYRADLVAAWGRAILTAAQMSDDEEHLHEMLDDYESRFSTVSPYLRVLLVGGSGPADVLRTFLADQPAPEPTTEDEIPTQPKVTDDVAAVDRGEAVAQLPPLFVPPPTPGARGQYILDAVDGVTEKFRQFNCDDIQELMNVLNNLGVSRFLPVKLVEKLQRPYIARMKSKTEDPEDVFAEMIDAGLKPVNAFPFTFVFMKSHTTKPPLDYYYLMMMQCGIKPVDSVYRVIIKNNQQLPKEDIHFLKRRMEGKNTDEPRWYDKKLSYLRGLDKEGVLEEASMVLQCALFEGIVFTKPWAFNKVIAMARDQPMLAEAWFCKMVELGVQPDSKTFSSLISLWKYNKLADSVDRWIAEMTSRGMQLDTANYISLLEGYAKSNRSRAQTCFKAILQRNEVTVSVYNTMMNLGPFDWAFGCLAAMLSDGTEPHHQTREIFIQLAKDEISNTIVDELEAAGWRKKELLTRGGLVAPPRGTTPSFHDCMRLMMRELKMSDEDMKQRSEMLTAEIDLAKRQ